MPQVQLKVNVEGDKVAIRFGEPISELILSEDIAEQLAKVINRRLDELPKRKERASAAYFDSFNDAFKK